MLKLSATITVLGHMLGVWISDLRGHRDERGESPVGMVVIIAGVAVLAVAVVAAITVYVNGKIAALP